MNIRAMNHKKNKDIETKQREEKEKFLDDLIEEFTDPPKPPPIIKEYEAGNSFFHKIKVWFHGKGTNHFGAM